MKKICLILALLFVASTLPACNSIKRVGGGFTIKSGDTAMVKTKKHGPPPHAPAHGYRHKHDDGVELEFNNSIGAYVVVDVSNLYFHNNLFIRYYGDGWQVAVRLDGPWRVAKPSEVPSKLKKGKGKGGNGKGRNKG